MDYEAEDKAALKRALIVLGTCPECRRPLRHSWSNASALSCVTCDEHYHKPEELIVHLHNGGMPTDGQCGAEGVTNPDIGLVTCEECLAWCAETCAGTDRS